MNFYLLALLELIVISHENTAKADPAINKVNTKIIGGEEAPPGRYPYQASLLLPDGSAGCGGTLIAADWVLSAAHCQGSYSQVELGRHNRSEPSEFYELIDIAFKVIHPEYEYVNKIKPPINDIMLVKLKTSSSYAPVMLDDGSSSYILNNLNLTLTPGTLLTAIGRGRTNATSPERPDVLLEAETEYINNTECEQIYSFRDYSIEDNMMCVINAERNSSSCKGDSGSPILIKGENTSLDIQVGVTSWAFACSPLLPQGKARVSAAIGFIKSVQTCNVPNETIYFFNQCCEATCIDGVFLCVSFQCIQKYPLIWNIYQQIQPFILRLISFMASFIETFRFWR